MSDWKQAIQITANLLCLCSGLGMEDAYNEIIARYRYETRQLIASVDRDGLALTTPEE